jgi:hypothetical protein
MEVEGQILGARSSQFCLPIGKVGGGFGGALGGIGTPSFASFIQQQHMQQNNSAMAIDSNSNSIHIGGFPQQQQQQGFVFGAPPK